MNEAMTERHGPKGNKPPETPFDTAESIINDLYDEAKLWLDGEEVETEDMAEGMATLLNALRGAGKDADNERAAEKKPHWDAGKAVDVKWKVLTDKAALATAACKKALTPWQVKKEAEKQEREAEARRIADEAAREAREAELAAKEASDSLAAQEHAQEAAEVARKADIGAQSAANASAGTKNRAGRAISLRTTYEAVLVDPGAAMRYYWNEPELLEVLTKLANTDARNGLQEIPGFTINPIQSVA